MSQLVYRLVDQLLAITFFFIYKSIELLPLVEVLYLRQATLCWIKVRLIRYILYPLKLKLSHLHGNLIRSVDSQVVHKYCYRVMLILNTKIVKVRIELGVIDGLIVDLVLLKSFLLRYGKYQGKHRLGNCCLRNTVWQF